MRQDAVQQTEFQANVVAVQPAPGAVFLSLRYTRAGASKRCMVAELTLGEAIALRRELDECIGVAVASATV